MNILSWNLNGLQACLSNGSFHPLEKLSLDIICFQETRTSNHPLIFPDYYHYWCDSERGGYAGTLTLTREKPLSVQFGVGTKDLDREGRLIILEFEKFYSINVYFPNSQGGLRRHSFRLEWDSRLLDLICSLDDKKPVIMCGDFNVTRSPIDIYPENARQMWKENGYMSEERDNLETLLESGFTDAFRYLYPNREGAYTWWSNRLNKRAQNRGWRLDYFCTSNRLSPQIMDVIHHTSITGSDHCPIELKIKL